MMDKYQVMIRTQEGPRRVAHNETLTAMDAHEAFIVAADTVLQRCPEAEIIEIRVYPR